MSERTTTPYLWVNKTSKSRFLSRSDHAETQHISRFVQQQRFVRKGQRPLELRLSNKENWDFPQRSSAAQEGEIHSEHGSGEMSTEFIIVGTR